MTRLAQWRDQDKELEIFKEGVPESGTGSPRPSVEEDVDTNGDSIEPASSSDEEDASEDSNDYSLQTNDLKDGTYEPTMELLKSSRVKSDRKLRSTGSKSKQVKMRRSVACLLVTEYVDL